MEDGQMEARKSSELRQGDVVHNCGIHVELDREIREYDGPYGATDWGRLAR